MLNSKLTTIFCVVFLVLTKVVKNEVYASPEPCKELMDIMTPKKLKKLKDDDKVTEKPKEDDKDEKIKQLKKLLDELVPSETTKKPEVKRRPSRLLNYMDFLTDLMMM